MKDYMVLVEPRDEKQMVTYGGGVTTEETERIKYKSTWKMYVKENSFT